MVPTSACATFNLSSKLHHEYVFTLLLPRPLSSTATCSMASHSIGNKSITRRMMSQVSSVATSLRCLYVAKRVRVAAILFFPPPSIADVHVPFFVTGARDTI